MRVIFNNLVYFVIKGTVVFCLDKFWNEKEIREIKKSKKI